MAIINIMKNKQTQNQKDLAFVLAYCQRKSKTTYEGKKLVSGINCLPESVFQEFMNTKRKHQKTDGRTFYHFTQSFHPDEQITPDLAHQIAVRFAEENFKDFEVLVATHTDRAHIHSHFVVNSVAFEKGYKYRSDNGNIERLRESSDKLCLEYNLSVIKERQESKQMSGRKYRSAERGESWKMQLIVAIEEAMKYARSKEDFILRMESEGYGVKWTDERKNITYTTPDGKKCRDSKLHEEKFRKENMENECRTREEITRRVERYHSQQIKKGGGRRSLYNGYGGTLAGDARPTRTTIRTIRENGRTPLHANHQARADDVYGRATEYPHGERYADSPSDGRIPNDVDGYGTHNPNGNQGVGQENGTTGWENERAIFYAALVREEGIRADEQETLLDFLDSNGGGILLGVYTLTLIGELTGDSRHKDYVEDCTTRKFVKERKKNQGLTTKGI